MVSGDTTLEGRHEVVPAHRSTLLICQSLAVTLSDPAQLASLPLAREDQVGVE